MKVIVNYPSDENGIALFEERFAEFKSKVIIELIRKIDFGEARVVITDGKPTRIEEIKKSIKL